MGKAFHDISASNTSLLLRISQPSDGVPVFEGRFSNPRARRTLNTALILDGVKVYPNVGVGSHADPPVCGLSRCSAGRAIGLLPY
jgi:hypothetical protein